MKTEDPDEVIVGGIPTMEDLFYVVVGEQMVKDSLPNLNHSIRHVVTLSTALFAGSVVIAKEHVVHPGVSIVCMLFFLAAVAVSGFGLIPHESAVAINCPDEVRGAIRDGVTFKRNLLIGSLSLIFMALAIVAIGVIARVAIS